MAKNGDNPLGDRPVTPVTIEAALGPVIGPDHELAFYEAWTSWSDDSESTSALGKRVLSHFLAVLPQAKQRGILRILLSDY